MHKLKLSHLLVAVYLFCCPLILSCSPIDQVQTTNSDPHPNDILRVGTIYGSGTYFIGIDQAKGFEYELAKGFADFLQMRLEILPFYSIDDLRNGLRAGDIDIVATGLSSPHTADNLKGDINWGPSYQKVQHHLVYLQGKKRPRKFEDLEGSLTVVKDSNHHQSLFTHIPLEHRIEINVTTQKDAEELLEDIATGKLDYTITDSRTLSLMRRRFPELSIGFTLDSEVELAWPMQRFADDRLQMNLLRYMAQLHSSGRLTRLTDKYFGHTQKFNFVDTKAFINAAREELPKYADAFKSASQEVDWRLLAALSYQESHWTPNAVSPTGVKGMMMLTLPTAKDWGVSSRLDPWQSIEGGGRYFASLVKRIPARIESPDRLWMALAAYNIGLGHLEDARILTQRQGGNPDIWVEVKDRLPQLQQQRFYRSTRYGYARGKEAVNYVANIRRYYDTLVWMDNQSAF